MKLASVCLKQTLNYESEFKNSFCDDYAQLHCNEDLL